MAVGIPALNPPPLRTTTTATTEPTPSLASSNTIATVAATSTSTTTRTSSSTRVATILCTVFPVLIAILMIAIGALWCRHGRRKQRGGRVASTIVIEELGLPPRLYHHHHHHHHLPPPPPPSSPSSPSSVPAEPAAELPSSSSEYPPPRRWRTARLSELLRRGFEPVFPHSQQWTHPPGRRVPSTTKATEPASSPSSFSSSTSSSPLHCAPPHEWPVDEHRTIARGAEATGQAVSVEQPDGDDGCSGRGEMTLRSNGLPRLPPPVYEP